MEKVLNDLLNNDVVAVKDRMKEKITTEYNSQKDEIRQEVGKTLFNDKKED